MSQESYKVSILVPVYGVEEYIERCARSVFEQTYRNLDIVFVDDCTPDKSIEILKRVLEDYPERKEQTRILCHYHNRGLSAARNTAMEVAKGRYIYFLDSDDSITNDCIEIMVKAMQSGKWDMVTADYTEIGLTKTDTTYKKVQLHDAEIFGDDILKSFSMKWHWNACNKLLDTYYLRKFGIKFIEGIYFEDVPFSFKIACTAHSIKVIGKSTYLYNYRPTSIMHKTDPGKYYQSYVDVAKGMREVQKKYSLFSYNSEKWIKVFEDKASELSHDSGIATPYQTYKAFRDFDKRTIREKWLCYSQPLRLLPVNLHYFLPKSLGFLWTTHYGWWRKRD